MTISMYQASVPRFANILGNLSNILDKTQAHIEAKKITDASLTSYRLFPDMLPMTRRCKLPVTRPRALWRAWLASPFRHLTTTR